METGSGAWLQDAYDAAIDHRAHPNEPGPPYNWKTEAASQGPMTETVHTRKLASIVAIDMAGYSRRTEADEEASVTAVSALKTRVATAAATHGGRVFNTAGDGFMLEFPTASGALAAAEEIANSDGPQVRAGVHVGEVFITESGDLLGHGVNVAARIQQMASAGAVLVSGDVRRAIRGSIVERLKPQGSVRLDKMSETLPVFALAPADGGRAKGRRRNVRRWTGGVGLAAGALLLAASAWISRGLWFTPAPAATRIAVAPIDAQAGAPWIKDFADGASDQILSVLSTRQMPILSGPEAAAVSAPDGPAQARKLGVRLLVGGIVRDSGNGAVVDIHFVDPKSRTTVWSATFQGDDQARTEDLRGPIATKVAAMLDCAARALRPGHGLSDPDALSSYLKSCDIFQLHGDDFAPDPTFQLFAALRRVISLAPDFAPAHSDLAKFEGYYTHFMPDAFSPEQLANLRKEARAEAARALALDPKSADSYVALAFLVPRPGWTEREKLLRQAIAADPEWPHGNGFLGMLLLEVGRMQEGAVYVQRAAAANPLSADLGWTSTSARVLSEAGRTDLADSTLAQLVKLWPTDSDVWSSRFAVDRDAGRWSAALALLSDPAKPSIMAPPAVAESKLVLRALQSRAPSQIAAARRQVLQTAKTVPTATDTEIEYLTILGDTDDAFKLAFSPAAVTPPDGPYEALFGPLTRPMRRDPRFIALAAHLGLLDYWRSTGKWPDFCSQPDLPYDCKTEAAKYPPRAR